MNHSNNSVLMSKVSKIFEGLISYDELIYVPIIMIIIITIDSETAKITASGFDFLRDVFRFCQNSS